MNYTCCVLVIIVLQLTNRKEWKPGDVSERLCMMRYGFSSNLRNSPHSSAR